MAQSIDMSSQNRDSLFNAIAAFTHAAVQVEAKQWALDKIGIDEATLSRLKNKKPNASRDAAERLVEFCTSKILNGDPLEQTNREWHNNNIGERIYTDILEGIYFRYPALKPKPFQPTFMPSSAPCGFDIEVRQNKIVFVSMSFWEVSRLEGNDTITFQVDRIFLDIDRGSGRVEGGNLNIKNSEECEYSARRSEVGRRGRWNVGRSDGPLDGVFAFFALCSLEGSARPGDDDLTDGVRQGDRFSAQFSVANLDVRSTLQDNLSDGIARAKVFRQFLVNKQYDLEANEPMLIFDFDLHGSQK